MLLTDEFIQVQARDGVGSPGMNSITLTLMVIHLYTPHVYRCIYDGTHSAGCFPALTSCHQDGGNSQLPTV